MDIKSASELLDGLFNNDKLDENVKKHLRIAKTQIDKTIAEAQTKVKRTAQPVVAPQPAEVPKTRTRRIVKE